MTTQSLIRAASVVSRRRSISRRAVPTSSTRSRRRSHAVKASIPSGLTHDRTSSIGSNTSTVSSIKVVGGNWCTETSILCKRTNIEVGTVAWTVSSVRGWNGEIERLLEDVDDVPVRRGVLRWRRRGVVEDSGCADRVICEEQEWERTDGVGWKRRRVDQTHISLEPVEVLRAGWVVRHRSVRVNHDRGVRVRTIHLDGASVDAGCGWCLNYLVVVGNLGETDLLMATGADDVEAKLLAWVKLNCACLEGHEQLLGGTGRVVGRDLRRGARREGGVGGCCHGGRSLEGRRRRGLGWACAIASGVVVRAGVIDNLGEGANVDGLAGGLCQARHNKSGDDASLVDTMTGKVIQGTAVLSQCRVVATY